MRLGDAKWLQWLLGIDSGSVPPDATAQMVLRNAPTSLAVFVLIGTVVFLAGLVLYLYHRENTVCPRGIRLLLAALRLSVLALLVAVYLDPMVYLSQRQVLEPTVWVLRDASQSMAATTDLYLDDRDAAIASAATGRSVIAIRSEHTPRATLVNDVLARDNQRVLRSLAQRGRPQVMDFAAGVEKVPLTLVKPAVAKPGAKPAAPGAQPRPMFELPPLVATGQATDLRRAIQEAVSDRFVAAIIVLTDGQHTVHDSDDLRRAAETARERNIPLLLVGVGDPNRPRNLQVTEIYANPQVWLQDPFEIQASLRAEGIAGESVEVSLIEQQLGENGAADGPERIVDHKPVQFPAGSAPVQVKFTRTAPAAGRFAYNVRAAQLPNEANNKDNEAETPAKVKVLSRKARVLLVSGEATWEYQLLLRLLKRQPWCNVSCWLQTMDLDRDQEGTTVIRRLPRTKEELYAYDVVLLLDPDPSEFNEAWIQLLKEFVGDHAGGLLYMAGPKFSGRFLAEPKTRLIQDLLPVSLGDVARLDAEQLLDEQRPTASRAYSLGVVPSNVDHPIMRFRADPNQSLARWQQLPGIYWSLPCDIPKPGTRMLIERGDTSGSQSSAARPLLVTGLYGSGRLVFVGFNGTWRWRRMPTLYEFYKTFWEQTVQFLVDGRAAEGQRRVAMETDRTQYTVGDRIGVTARLWTPAGTPLESPRATATLSTSNAPAEQIELKPVANVPGQYATTLIARQKGMFELSMELPSGASGTPPRDSAPFSVTLPSVELEKPWLNKPLLVELAKLSGGRYFDLNEVDQLAGAVPDRKQIITVQSKSVLVRDSSRKVLIIFVVGLLAVEWSLRKKFKLI